MVRAGQATIFQLRDNDNATTKYSLRNQSGTRKKSKNGQASVSRWGTGSNNEYCKMEITNNFMA